MTNLNLYDRDYNIVDSFEEQEYSKILELEKIDSDISIGLNTRKNLFREYPKAIRHNQSLFPNNYLDIVDLDDKQSIQSNIDCLLSEINNSILKKETDILDFINKRTKAFYFIGSIFNYYDFGHHEAFIFPEFQLGNQYKVDYLLIGKNSSGYSFIFIELEDPLKQITLKNGNSGNSLRKGIDQTKDWKRFLETNYDNFQQTLKNKYKNPKLQLPDEFYTFDPTRNHFVVVAGLRSNFQESTRRIAREHLSEQNIRILHYENLYDSAQAIIEQKNY